MDKKEKEVILSVNNIDIVFKNGKKVFKAVDGVSFDIYKGETLSLVGESGSGKTTIGRAIVRINPLAKGNIKYKGKVISGKKTKEEVTKEKNQLKELLNERKVLVEQIENLKNKIMEETINSSDKNVFNKALKRNDEYNQLDLKLKELDFNINYIKNPKKFFKEITRQIQMIFQDPAASLNERATIEYIVSEGLYNFKLYKDEKDRIQKVQKIIEDVGLLPEHLTRYPHEFSGGQRQRVGLARSIIMEPEFIVADEPISALDVSIRAQVLNLLKKFQNERDLTYLFIAHDLSIVRFISDRIVVIYKGKLVEIAPTEELFNYPLHPYTKSLMSAIPIPDPILENQKELFVYDPSIHDYSKEKPHMVDLGNGHFIYGSDSEIANYKKIRFGE